MTNIIVFINGDYPDLLNNLVVNHNGNRMLLLQESCDAGMYKTQISQIGNGGNLVRISHNTSPNELQAQKACLPEGYQWVQHLTYTRGGDPRDLWGVVTRAKTNNDLGQLIGIINGDATQEKAVELLWTMAMGFGAIDNEAVVVKCAEEAQLLASKIDALVVEQGVQNDCLQFFQHLASREMESSKETHHNLRNKLRTLCNP